MRIFVIPDGQNRKETPADHWDWIGEAVAEYEPDAVIEIGDFWDMPSLGTHDPVGSLKMEGARYEDDIAAGNTAFARLDAPIRRKIRQRRGRWNPDLYKLMGNHEERIPRAINREPKYAGVIGLHHLDTRGWKRLDYLERLWLEGVVFSHFFQSTHSHYAIGGSIDNMLNKIGNSFVAGHVQGRKDGSRITAAGKTWHGFVYGSCYTHIEGYRGAQGQRHFRGCLVLNEVRDGDMCPMVLSLDYLCRKYERKSLLTYMTKKYPKGDWRHLA